MTKIQLGDKTIEIGDGLNVEVSGDRIIVTPAVQHFVPVIVWPLGQPSPNVWPAIPVMPLQPSYPGPSYPGDYRAPLGPHHHVRQSDQHALHPDGRAH